MIPAPELPNLTPEEISLLDLRIAGKLIKDQALALSHKVNNELMQPISNWLDDPDWMTRFKVYEDNLPNWAEYKRNQREWSQQQRDLFRQRMKMYWQEIHRKRNLKSEVAKMLKSSRVSTDNADNADNAESKRNSNSKYAYLSPILTPYSPPEEHKRNTHQEFMQALSASVSNLLPWRTILLSEIQEHTSNETMTLNKMKTYYMEDPRKDISSKLMHLLQLDTEGAITLSQSEPFGDICISSETKTVSSPLFSNRTDTHESTHDSNQHPYQHPKGSDTYSSIIMIKTRDGKSEDVDWQQLSNAQRSKVVADIKDNKILCKAVLSPTGSDMGFAYGSSP